jgi:hypothetical protein
VISANGAAQDALSPLAGERRPRYWVAFAEPHSR